MTWKMWIKLLGVGKEIYIPKDKYLIQLLKFQLILKI